jgi:NAD(P)H-dependent FMN reductase
MKLSILLGSVREGRQTHKIAQYLLHQFEAQAGIEPTLIDLKAAPVPIFESRWQQQETPNAALVALGAHLSEADAMIFVSPEYHGSYSGVLKNAVDHYWKEFSRKPIGVVATGAGQFGGLNGSTEMQQLVLSLGAFPMPFKLLVPRIKDAFDAEEQLIHSQTAELTSKFVQEFLWFARAIVAAKAQQPTS